MAQRKKRQPQPRSGFFTKLVILALLAAQLLLLFAGFFRLGEYTVYGGSMLLSMAVALVVVNRPANPAIKITWILLIMLAPVFAVPLYLFVDLELGHRLARARLEEISRETAPYTPPCPEVLSRLQERDRALAGLGTYMERSAGQRFYENSGALYLESGEAFSPLAACGC